MHQVTQQLAENLSKGRFKIRTGAQLGVRDIVFVASKNIFVPMVLGVVSAHVVALEKNDAKARDFDELFDTGFKVAKKINWIPLPRGLQFGYAVMPLIVDCDPDPESLLYAVSSQEMRWALLKYPILVDLKSKQLAYFNGNSSWALSIWPSLLEIVTRYIKPSIEDHGL